MIRFPSDCDNIFRDSPTYSITLPTKWVVVVINCPKNYDGLADGPIGLFP